MALKQWHEMLLGVVCVAALGSWLEARTVREQREADMAPVEAPFRTSQAPSDLQISPRVMQVGPDQVEVFDVPSTPNPYSTRRTTRRCYVFRDLAFRTSTITCPQDGETPALASAPSDAPG